MQMTKLLFYVLLKVSEVFLRQRAVLLQPTKAESTARIEILQARKVQRFRRHECFFIRSRESPVIVEIRNTEVQPDKHPVCLHVMFSS